jgi:hypothetical protein
MTVLIKRDPNSLHPLQCYRRHGAWQGSWARLAHSDLFGDGPIRLPASSSFTPPRAADPAARPTISAPCASDPDAHPTISAHARTDRARIRQSPRPESLPSAEVKNQTAKIGGLIPFSTVGRSGRPSS